MIEQLEDKDLLPCIYFIFSRAACEDAVRQCVRDGMRLLDRSSRRRIRAIAEERTADLGDEDLEALGLARVAGGRSSAASPRTTRGSCRP